MGDMIYIYKILHGLLESIQLCDVFQMADVFKLRRHSLKPKKVQIRLDLRKWQTVMNMWNELPADVFTAPTAKAFKSLLEANLKNLPRWLSE